MQKEIKYRGNTLHIDLGHRNYAFNVIIINATTFLDENITGIELIVSQEKLLGKKDYELIEIIKKEILTHLKSIFSNWCYLSATNPQIPLNTDDYINLLYALSNNDV